LLPVLASGWYNQGVAMNALGLFKGAIAAYGKTLELVEANNADVLTGRGMAQIKLEDYAAAAIDLQAALTINPNHSPAQKAFQALPEP
jgi:tetratricopeptide (TPR) repeat protein